MTAVAATGPVVYTDRVTGRQQTIPISSLYFSNSDGTIKATDLRQIKVSDDDFGGDDAVDVGGRAGQVRCSERACSAGKAFELLRPLAGEGPADADLVIGKNVRGEVLELAQFRPG